MKKTTFYDWTVHYPEHLTAVKDDTEKKWSFLNRPLNLKELSVLMRIMNCKLSRLGIVSLLLMQKTCLSQFVMQKML